VKFRKSRSVSLSGHISVAGAPGRVSAIQPYAWEDCGHLRVRVNEIVCVLGSRSSTGDQSGRGPRQTLPSGWNAL
jgi:hypothetical protein